MHLAIPLLILAPLGLLAIGHRVFQPAPLSPVWIVVAVVSGVGTLGYLLSDYLFGANGGSVVVQLTEQERLDTALIFASTSWLITIGAFASVFLMGRRSQRATIRDFELSPRIRTVALLISVLPLIVIIAALGETLFHRSVYLAGERGGSLFGLGQQLGTATVAIAGYVAVAGTKRQKTVAVLIALVYLAVFFGLGSRRLALFPIVIAIGAILAKPNRWARYLVPGLIFAAILLPLPLFLRGSVDHGLFPYAAQLLHFDLFAVDWRSTLNNVLISFPITGATVYQASPIPMEYFWISLNPLPGSIAGFYDIPENLGLNRYTPYSTIGEVWNRGAAVGMAFWVIVGIVLAWLDRQVGRWLESRHSYVGLGVVVLSALFALTCIQYNLRSSGRMLVYATIITIAAAIIFRLRSEPPPEAAASKPSVVPSAPAAIES